VYGEKTQMNLHDEHDLLDEKNALCLQWGHSSQNEPCQHVLRAVYGEQIQMNLHDEHDPLDG
jgi:hypothetical protein